MKKPSTEDLIEGKVQKPNITIVYKIGYRAQSPGPIRQPLLRKKILDFNNNPVKPFKGYKTARMLRFENTLNMYGNYKPAKILKFSNFSIRDVPAAKGKMCDINFPKPLLKKSQNSNKSYEKPKKCVTKENSQENDISGDIPDYEEAEIHSPQNFRASKLIHRFTKSKKLQNGNKKLADILRKFPQILSKICEFLGTLDLCKIYKNIPQIKFRKIKQKLKENIMEGLNTENRILFWKFCSNLNITNMKNTYEFGELLKKPSNSTLLISQDVIRTFPPLEYFKPGKESYNKMMRILKCISLKIPSVGYCQGMNFIVGLILLFLNDEIVFFIQIINILAFIWIFKIFI